MLLMPDSRLYIVPIGGGKSRMLNSNLYSMNSWQAWSPKCRWIVFASKGLSLYTDMFLAHSTRVVKSGDIEKAKTLFHKLESQNPFFFAEDCLELIDLFKTMG
jgi:hypothetical protein